MSDLLQFSLALVTGALAGAALMLHGLSLWKSRATRYRAECHRLQGMLRDLYEQMQRGGRIRIDLNVINRIEDDEDPADWWKQPGGGADA